MIKFRTLILLFCLTLIAITTVFFAARSGQPNMATPTNSNIHKEISYIEYPNAEYGFSLKYPDGYILDHQINGDCGTVVEQTYRTDGEYKKTYELPIGSLIPIKLTESPNETILENGKKIAFYASFISYYGACAQSNLLTISVIKKDKNFNLASYLDKETTSADKGAAGGATSGGAYLLFVDVNGKNIPVIRSSDASSVQNTTDHYFYDKGDYLYILTHGYSGYVVRSFGELEKNNDTYARDLMQVYNLSKEIINNFSFTKNDPPIVDLGLKTVKLSDYLEINIPIGWELRKPIVSDCTSVDCKRLEDTKGDSSYKIYDPKVSRADEPLDQNAVYISQGDCRDIGVHCVMPESASSHTQRYTSLTRGVTFQIFGTDKKVLAVYNDLVKQFSRGVTHFSNTKISLDYSSYWSAKLNKTDNTISIFVNKNGTGLVAKIDLNKKCSDHLDLIEKSSMGCLSSAGIITEEVARGHIADGYIVTAKMEGQTAEQAISQIKNIKVDL